MPRASLRRPKQDSGAGRRASGSWLLVLAAVAVWGGCSVAEHYETLSFFFDGVPDPRLAAMEAEAERTRQRETGETGTGSVHQAYMDRRCSDCHSGSARFGLVVRGFSALGAEVCMKCHEPVLHESPRLHGPVALRECMLCHEAHSSRHPSLLKSPSPDLCLSCHGREMKQPPIAPEHEDLERNCLDCHYGHGGDDPYFLRPLSVEAEILDDLDVADGTAGGEELEADEEHDDDGSLGGDAFDDEDRESEPDGEPVVDQEAGPTPIEPKDDRAR